MMKKKINVYSIIKIIAIDVTQMFDKEKNCYLVINNGEKDIYFVMSYED